MSMRKYAPLVLMLMLAGCVTARTTLPNRSATEQMLISEAAEAAALAIHLKLPNRKAFLDTTNFDGVDAKYAVSAIRQSLLQQGNALVDNRADSEIIVEVRAGALSIDSATRTIGIPTIQLPSLFIPGVQAIARTKNQGIAKFSLFAYDRLTGKLIAVVAPVIGISARDRTTYGSVIAWNAL